MCTWHVMAVAPAESGPTRRQRGRTVCSRHLASRFARRYTVFADKTFIDFGELRKGWADGGVNGCFCRYRILCASHRGVVVEQAAEVTAALFRVEDMTVSYPRASGRARLFAGLGFALDEATIYDLVGPSGSGKSTLLRACALMIERESGRLYLGGESSSDMPVTQWRKRVCLVPQKPSLVSGTVRDNLVLPWTLKVRADESAPRDGELADLLAKAELGDVELERDVSQLSGGQLARIALLRAFAAKPAVLLLDEVDAALDADSACAIGRLAAALVGTGMTCLRIRHRAADGFAAGTFELKAGSLSYSENAGGALPCARSAERPEGAEVAEAPVSEGAETAAGSFGGGEGAVSAGGAR